MNNTIGIRTKKAPNNNYNSFYSDDEYDQNILKIKEDIDKILDKIKDGYIIVLSNGGYGTGLAKLNIKAPKTFKYLCDELFDNFNFKNFI